MANPLAERTSVQVILVIVVIAFLCNSATSHTDEGLPWEVTLAGACTFGVVFSAYYAQKTEIALSICAILAGLIPTYYVWTYEVPCNNWELGSKFPLSTSRSALLSGVFRDAPNASRFDVMLPGGLSLIDLSIFSPGLMISANTSEIYHSGVKLDDKVTKEKTHDYLLISSPRKVKKETVGVMLLARVPVKFEVWPQEAEDYSFDLQTAAHIVAPPTFTGELVKLDKGPAMAMLQKKHNLRPFLLDVYNVEYHFD